MNRERIAYDVWINSQLSVARFYGGINIDGKYYEYDREVVKQMSKDNDDNILYKPDLVHYPKQTKQEEKKPRQS